MPAAPTLAAMSAALDEIGVTWGVLNDPVDITSGLDSDLDVVVNQDARAVVASAQAVLSRSGALALMAVNYDLGGWAAWFGNASAVHRGQFDFLHDPRGVGRLALPTAPLIASVGRYDGLPYVAEPWRVAYRITKSLGKGQWDRLSAARGLATATDQLEAVFGSEARARLQSLEGAPGDVWEGAAPSLLKERLRTRAARIGVLGEIARLSRRFRRAASRVVHPVGRWIHVHGLQAAPVAAEIEAWGRGVLPSCSMAPADSAVAGRSIAPRLLRPHLAVTWSAHPVRFVGYRPGLQLPAAAGALEEVVAEMARVTTARLA